MKTTFEQISIKPGFMKHNGGLLFKEISKTEKEKQLMEYDKTEASFGVVLYETKHT